MPKITGEVLRVYGWSCRGVFSLASLEHRLTSLVKFCGMTPVGEVLSWGYPLNGKGGIGHTVLLPFGEGQVPLTRFQRWLLKWMMRRFRWAFLSFQPFVESFAVIDTYPEICKVAIVLVTCLTPPKGLRNVVVRLFGPLNNEPKYFEL